MRGDSFKARASRAIAATDSIRTLGIIEQGKTSVASGAIRLSSPNANHVLAEVDTLRALLSNPVGAIAAAHPDSVSPRDQLDSHPWCCSHQLIRDVQKSHPMPLHQISDLTAFFRHR